MSKLVQLKNGLSIQLESTPFASGGEGDLFKIISPFNFNNQVVKIYKSEKRTKEREAKIEFLISNPPNLQVQDGHHTVIWMSQIVYENGKFIGFVMPIGKGKELEFLCHEKKPKSLTAEWDKFNFSNKSSLELRLKLCFNIAVALYHIHKLRIYVLVDLKPQNILVQPNGLISIIDIDSVAVLGNNKVIFAAPVTTPEYTPPEYYKKSIQGSSEYIHETWDRFSLSVIFYRLLCGIHPFTGSCLTPYDKCNGLPEMVENGLFPNGLKKNYFKVIPTPHQNFNKLEPKIQEIFKQCFEGGHTNANKRPTANEWCQILSNQKIVQVNRPFPSSLVSFPAVIFSKPMIYNPSTLVAFPNINYSQNLKVSGFRKVISKLFGKSNQQILVEAIIAQEQYLRFQSEKKEAFEQELQDILNAFHKQQLFVLEKEKERIEDLKKSFGLQKEGHDKTAKTFFSQEQQDLDSILKDINNSISMKEYSIQLYYKYNIQNRFESNENSKSSIQRRIYDLQNQMNAEIKQQTNHPSKLSNYNIASNAMNIFTYYEIANLNDLRTYGFTTAADFTDTDSYGLLNHRQKGWIKVPGIAKVRAAQLNKWRKDLELKEDLNISHLIHLTYQNNFNTLNHSFSKVENDFKKEIQPYQAEYEKQKQDLILYKIESSKLIQEKNKLIKNKFDDIHKQLNMKYKDQELLLNALLNSILDATTDDLNKNLQNYTLLYLDKWNVINTYIGEMNQEINKLSNLQNEYSLFNFNPNSA